MGDLMPSLVWARNPFAPHERVIETVSAGQTVRALLDARGIVEFAVQPTVCILNGEPLLRADWPLRTLGAGDVLAFVMLPLGGGGGASNPLRIVLQIALIALSFAAPGLAGVAAGTWQAAAISAGVMIGGSLLINALLPTPRLPSTQQGASASPTYSLQAQGNTARLMEAIPVLYGRFRIYCDYGAQPYAEYAGNEQFLYQLFVVTQGELSIEALRIEDTLIASFPDITYEVVPPGSAVTLFPDNVVTSVEVGGQNLPGINEPAAGWVGPFVANPAGSRANWIAVDLVLPSGLLRMSEEGEQETATVAWEVQAQAIDDSGTPTGSWVSLGAETLALSEITPQRLSRRFGVAPARYQVRVQRTDTKATDTRTADALQWQAMRAYLPSERLYGDCTLLAMRMCATGTLSQLSARRINIIGTRKLPIWNGSTWSAPTATRNPAWALADIVRNATYGGRLADSRLDLAGLLALANTWAARGDAFDGVYDQRVTLWEALSRCARVGRAVPICELGVVRIVRDQPATVREAMFTPRNIVAGSLGISYVFTDSAAPDHVIVEYVDGDTWQPAEVVAALPGSAQLNAERIQLFGCSGRAHAWREGMYVIAAHRDQRRQIRLRTEMEGHIPGWGALVTVAHDLPQWGYSGEIAALAGVSVTTTEPLVWTAGQTHWLAIRSPTGSVDGPYQVTAGTHARECLLPAPLSWVPVIDGRRERPHYQFGPGTRWALDCRLISARPVDDLHVELTLVNAADSPHTAELTGAPPSPPPASLLPGIPAGPVVGALAVVDALTPGVALASWTGASGATRYEIQTSRDGSAWTPWGSTADTGAALSLAAGAAWVRVRGIGGQPGPWRTWSGTLGTRVLPPARPGVSMQGTFTGTFFKVQWLAIGTATYYVVRVLTGTTLQRETTVTDTTYTYSYEMAVADSAVAASYTVEVLAGNAGGESATGSVIATNPAPAAPAADYEGPLLAGDYRVFWPAADIADLAGYQTRVNGGSWSTVGAALELTGLAVSDEVEVRAMDIWGSFGSVCSVTIPPPPGP